METQRKIKPLLFIFLILGVFLMHPVSGVEIQTLVNVLQTNTSPFSYPLDVKIYKGKTANEGVILCCHGYGSDSSIASIIASYKPVPEHLVGFNFPDYSIHYRRIPADQVAYGTVKELLPVIYLLKKIVVDGQTERESLYGFSAGGAAVVNVIALLNTASENTDLNSIVVTREDVQKILAAL